jgi:tetratricopeptide (TPR) repeat protein
MTSNGTDRLEMRGLSRRDAAAVALRGWVGSLLCWGLLLCGSAARAESANDVAAAAQASYWQGDYEAAAAGFGRLHQDFGIENASVYFNAGTAWAQAGKLGRAVAAFKRAQRFGASGELGQAIDSNLAHTRAALTERYRKELPEEQFVFTEPTGFAYRVFHTLSVPTTQWIAAALWALALILLTLRRLGRLPQKASAAILAVGAAWALATTMVVGQWATGRGKQLGVVVTANGELREGRHPDAPAKPLPEGLEVLVLDATDPDFVKLGLANGKTGWASREVIEEI